MSGRPQHPSVTYFQRPTMPAGFDYALLPDARPNTKPFAFADLAALVRHIHRSRRGQALQLQNDRVMVKGEPAARQVVAVYAEDQTGSRTRFIGYAWLKGRSEAALRAALASAEPLAQLGGVKRRKVA